jgi:hypothetical protein
MPCRHSLQHYVGSNRLEAITLHRNNFMPGLTLPEGGVFTALGVPLGTILPYVGPLTQLGSNWVICDGEPVQDPDSPFHGQRVPKLTDERFLMGVPAAGEVMATGGRNDIPGSGVHGHSVSFSGYGKGEINYARGQGHQDDYQMRYSAGGDGDHNHQGDNRPQFLTVHYIVRVK